MKAQEIRETVRQMLNDWNNATDQQRTESLEVAAKKAYFRGDPRYAEDHADWHEAMAEVARRTLRDLA